MSQVSRIVYIYIYTMETEDLCVLPFPKAYLLVAIYHPLTG